MPIALETFVKHLTDSGIIAPGKLENFIPPKAIPKDAQELARQLVQSRQLTRYQAQEIYSGRARSLILGNYTILDKIGAGGMGQVFKAEHRRMKRVVAIKMLPNAVTKDAAAAARFQREVEAAAKLEHPNIVAAHDADEANGVHFLVMQYVAGSDLSVLVKKHGPFSVAKAVNYILQAARGLEFAHKRGVIHRDIKPANLLLDAEGTVKVLDMGLARIEAGGDAAAQAELTGTGAIMGTVDYMAPEQGLSTKHADARADIYSLGCSLYYLIAAKPLYDGETLAAKLIAHHNQPIPDLREVQPDISEPLDAVFRKMVAKTVDDRYQTMSEVIAALEQSSANQPSSPSIQQPVGTGSSSDVMTFLRNAALNTINKPKATTAVTPAKQPAATNSRKGNKKLILGVGAAFLGAAILAGIIFKLRTKDGTLMVEINQPDAVVEVLDEQGKIEITRPGEKGTVSISVDPGKHRLKVEKDGFVVFGQDFSIESGDSKTIKATLEEVQPWLKAAFLQWQKEVAALPAEDQVKAVVTKLQELNPKYGGQEQHAIENGAVTQFTTDIGPITDISPVRALPGLKMLWLGSNNGRSLLGDLAPLGGMPLTGLHIELCSVSDLSPLTGLPLTFLEFLAEDVSDLSPIAGMPLKNLGCSGSMVADLSPLKGMKLQRFECNTTLVSDLSVLRGMPLNYLGIRATKVSDLAALQGMSLNGLDCSRTSVADLSPLKNFPLQQLNCDDTQVSDLSSLADCKTLTFISCKSNKISPADFAALQTALPDCKIERLKPITKIDDPAFKQWLRATAELPADKQVEAVAKKLQELNPDFDGKVEPEILNGTVRRLRVCSDYVTDISPVRAIKTLHDLDCNGSHPNNGQLADLSPLRGIQLTALCLPRSVYDLSPLAGMPLTIFSCPFSLVSDLSPLKGAPLQRLYIQNCTAISDLAPLQGMPLTELTFSQTHVSDLSPLAGMKLRVLGISSIKIVKGIEAIRHAASMEKICPGDRWGWLPEDEFWRKYDAGEFK